MYRQILVNDNQHCLQQIFWRNHTNEPIQQYHLKTVTYGTASAPYLATRVLQQLADDERDQFPLAAPIVKSDFYVDDVLSGAASLEEAQSIQDQLIGMLRRGGLELHKWCANNVTLLSRIQANDLEKRVIVGDSETVSTLGLVWQPDTDQFVFSVHQKLLAEREVTKRTILSDIARLFDPLGLTGPIILTAKLMMQTLWQKNIDWDQAMDETDRDTWLRFRSQLRNMSDIQIPRYVMPTAEIQCVYLLGFCDAATRAYGACVYLFCKDMEGNHMTHLLCSKSKVAPLKVLTVPRLELCSAVLLAQLIQKVESSMQLVIKERILWSDSTVALGWIRSNSNEAKTFVSHRIAEIQNITKPSEWRYIPTSKNPADVISRGLMPDEIHECRLWWSGPEFLSTAEENWFFNSTSDETLPEMKPSVLVVNTLTTDKWKVLERYGQFLRLQRVMALVLRFINNCKSNKSERETSFITSAEMSNSLNCIVRATQIQELPSEYICLSNGETISKKSSLQSQYFYRRQ